MRKISYEVNKGKEHLINYTEDSEYKRRVFL